MLCKIFHINDVVSECMWTVCGADWQELMVPSWELGFFVPWIICTFSSTDTWSVTVFKKKKKWKKIRRSEIRITSWKQSASTSSQATKECFYSVKIFATLDGVLILNTKHSSSEILRWGRNGGRCSNSQVFSVCVCFSVDYCAFPTDKYHLCSLAVKCLPPMQIWELIPIFPSQVVPLTYGLVF